MPLLEEDPDHLASLAGDIGRLAQRTDQARRAAIGFSDWGPGNAHDPALNEAIDWFYRRWVQEVETLRDLVEGQSHLLNAGRDTYQRTETAVRGAVDDQPPGRLRRYR